MSPVQGFQCLALFKILIYMYQYREKFTLKLLPQFFSLVNYVLRFAMFALFPVTKEIGIFSSHSVIALVLFTRQK